MSVIYQRKVGWFGATRRFILNKDETTKFKTIATSAAAALRVLGIGGAPLSLLDDAANIIPVVNIWTIGNDLLLVYGAYAVCRIVMIRREANRPKAVRR
jgi:hypothetical protein